MKGQNVNVLLVSGPSVLGADQEFASFAGGAIATYMGWRWIFIFSIIFALLAMWLIKDTPESKGESTGAFKFDYYWISHFYHHNACIKPFYYLWCRFGLDKPAYISLAVVAIIGIIVFVKVEKNKDIALN